ncbi:hypothetical protein G3813_005729 [Escherichia coli]|nr:hypothetical protein [Escherichia coli]
MLSHGNVHIFWFFIRRQLVLPTRANYTGRPLQCDIKCVTPFPVGSCK